MDGTHDQARGAALGAVAFMVLDGVWLGLLMKNFYRDQLAWRGERWRRPRARRPSGS
jgi:hypothetical protein